jgi:large subunit ribosomal protein L13
MKTTYFIKEKDIQKKWFIVDADGKTLGRISTQIAVILRGKNKPTFTPHADMGDNVIVVNADKVRLIKNKPERVIQFAVKGMLPHNNLGRAIIKHLKVYRGPEHPHKAQQPVLLEL